MKSRRLASDASDFRHDALREAGVSNRIALFEFDPENVGQEFGAQGARFVDVALTDQDGAPLGMAEGGELVRPTIVAMHDDGAVDGQHHRYAARFTPARAGRYGYTVRVVTAREDLSPPLDLGLVAWAR